MTERFKTPKFWRILPLAAIAVLAFHDAPIGLAFFNPAYAAEGIRIPAHAAKMAEPKGNQIAIFSGGCFWGVEGIFDHVKGVISAQSGYAGGTKATADYETVSSGTTGHAESVRIIYDPAKISYDDLMQIFFSVALDPTELNHQGPDSGTQYRNAIFAVTPEQAKAARSYIAQLSAKSPWGKKPVTKVESGTFYKAEAYHQDFMKNNPNHGYIRMWDAPKVANLKRLFPARYR
jgi:peptide-methionine (S)-S-oxide reductase